MEKNNKQNKSVTIANIVSIVGLVLLLVFTYIGNSYMSGGEIGVDLFFSIIITAFAAFLLWLMIKAKGAENRVKMWKKVEYGTLGLYVLLAIPVSLFGGINHFFAVNGNKEQIKTYAQNDLQKISRMFETYEDFERTALNATIAGLENAIALNQVRDESLNEFMEENKISPTQEGVESFTKIQNSNLLGDGYKEQKDFYLKKISEIEESVNSWSMMTVPLKAKEIEEVAQKAGEELTKRSENAKLPNIGSDMFGRHTLTGENQSREYTVEGGIQGLEFRKALRQAEGFSPMAVVLVLLIHVLILFNYIMAYRTDKTDIGGGLLAPDGGYILG